MEIRKEINVKEPAVVAGGCLQRGRLYRVAAIAPVACEVWFCIDSYRLVDVRTGDISTVDSHGRFIELAGFLTITGDA